MTDFRHPDHDRAAHALRTSTGPTEIIKEDINRARQAAEALFAPKLPVTESAAPVAITPTEQPTPKPRILSAGPAQPTRVDPIAAPVKDIFPKKREQVTAAHSALIRTWLKYGMTISQVAEVYGVTVGEIESIMHNA